MCQLKKEERHLGFKLPEVIPKWLLLRDQFFPQILQ
jgi:hypothetical protein